MQELEKFSTIDHKLSETRKLASRSHVCSNFCFLGS